MDSQFFPTMIRGFMVSLLCALISGCARPEQPTIFDQESDLLTVNKHNDRLAAKGNWSIETWTSCSLFGPGGEISIFIRVTSNDTDVAKPQVKATIRFSASGVTANCFARQYQLDLKSTDQRISGWEVSYEAGKWGTKVRAPKAKNIWEAVVTESPSCAMGDYVIQLDLVINNEVDLKFSDMKVKSWPPRSVPAAK